MDNYADYSPEELAAFVEMTDDKEALREIAKLVGASFSGNSGVEKLKESITAAVPLYFAKKEAEEDATDPNDPVLQALAAANVTVEDAPAAPKKKGGIPPNAVLLKMNEFTETNPVIKRAIVRAKALQLIRCRITNMDPNDAVVNGMLLTVYNKFTGKVSKYIPFGEENEHGYHLPKILFDELNARTYNLRKEIKNQGSQFGIKQYKTIKVKKFNLEVLPPLKPKELQTLGEQQQAKGAIDRTAI